MVTMQNERQASTTIYEPDSFVPMLRVDRQLQADERRAKGETRTYHVHCNHLGTPEALIDHNSLQLVWQIELDPWGQTQREYNPNNMLQPIRMQGQQLDAETGLFYNRYRYYDPAGGRYITQDPIGLAGGVNLYGYVGGKPTGYFDPVGRQAYPAGYNPLKSPMYEKLNPLPENVKKQGAACVGDFIKNLVTKATEGGNAGVAGGGTMVIGAGVQSSAGVLVDTVGRKCLVTQVCGVVGPMFAVTSDAGLSGATGLLTPGDVSWSISGIGRAAIGPFGGKVSLGVANDGSISGQGGASQGVALGGALLVCRQEVTKTCSK
jgi:RHS repeat-associated protein